VTNTQLARIHFPTHDSLEVTLGDKQKTCILDEGISRTKATEKESSIFNMAPQKTPLKMQDTKNVKDHKNPSIIPAQKFPDHYRFPTWSPD
jgi:hypothetical protein